jgi:hypothetical protein
MKMTRKAFAIAAAAMVFSGAALLPAPAQTQTQASTQASAPGQTPRTVDLPVTKVVLFSSGVGYFEHRGQLSGDCAVPLPFAVSEVNDALKSLLVSDGASSPSVSYPSQASLDRSLKGLRIDLSGAPRVADLLARLRGAEISIDTPETITGRIVSVEQKAAKADEPPRPFVVLLTASGLRSVSLDDAQALRFSDKGIGEDFDRALSLILAARDERSRRLEVRFPGSGSRQATIGYVIAAPVWKASYRLDLSQAKPQLQGWAIVDNPSDQDWRNVSLSLVSGRPVSFVQELYPPVYLDRPVLPLAIAGIAAARSFESGLAFAAEPEEEMAYDRAVEKEGQARAKKAMAPPAPSMAPAPAAGYASTSAPLGQRNLETASAEKAGDQFQFTVKKPVSLERGRSAMLPLVAGDIEAERVSVLSPGARRPMLGARLVNTTGLRLPAGPIAVFDGGVYAGDSLLDFLSEKEARLIVFGDDLGVGVDASGSSSQETVGVTVEKGVMTFSRRVTVAKTYAFKNGTADAKKLVVEHPITGGAELFEPKKFDEKTEGLYRFDLALPAAGQAKLVVKERYPRSERVVLGNLRAEDFLAYSSSQEIPAKVRDALKKAIDLRRKLNDADRALADLTARKESLVADQSRYRSNLSQVGRDSSQGQQYLKRLMDSEAAIDQTVAKIDDAQEAKKKAQSAYESYLAELSL